MKIVWFSWFHRTQPIQWNYLKFQFFKFDSVELASRASQISVTIQNPQVSDKTSPPSLKKCHVVDSKLRGLMTLRHICILSALRCARFGFSPFNINKFFFKNCRPKWNFRNIIAALFLASFILCCECQSLASTRLAVDIRLCFSWQAAAEVRDQDARCCDRTGGTRGDRVADAVQAVSTFRQSRPSCPLLLADWQPKAVAPTGSRMFRSAIVGHRKVRGWNLTKPVVGSRKWHEHMTSGRRHRRTLQSTTEIRRRPQGGRRLKESISKFNRRSRNFAKGACADNTIARLYEDRMRRERSFVHSGSSMNTMPNNKRYSDYCFLCLAKYALDEWSNPSVTKAKLHAISYKSEELPTAETSI